jgi:hypothetical protein
MSKQFSLLPAEIVFSCLVFSVVVSESRKLYRKDEI